MSADDILREFMDCYYHEGLNHCPFCGGTGDFNDPRQHSSRCPMVLAQNYLGESGAVIIGPAEFVIVGSGS